jgi:hypothetical protein
MSEQPNEDQLKRIRALLRKTEEAGATPEESKSAMDAAFRLMAKYGIDKMVVDQEDEGPKKLNIVKVRFETGRDKNPRDNYIMSILEQCFGIRALWSIGWELIPEEKRKPYKDHYKKRMVYVLIGDQTDVDMAKEVIYDLNRIMRNSLERHLRDTGKTWNAVTASSFWSGMTTGYTSVNKVAREEALLEAGKSTADKYALAVVDKNAAIENFIQTAVTVRAARKSSVRSFGWDHEANNQGRAEGTKLNLKNKRIAK